MDETERAAGQRADLILRGGTVWSAGWDVPVPGAVAVRAGRIAFVGPEADARGWAGPDTRIVDVPGSLVVPGFQDAHCHPISSGLERLTCDLNDVHGADAYVRTVAGYAASHPDEPWIVGGGWSMDAFEAGCPSRGLLDAVVPDRPVFLPNRDGHGAWVNSRALAEAGIDASTPDPPDGRIEREADGSAQGTLHEGAMELVRALVPAFTADDQVAGLEEGQRYLHSNGVTAWQDAIVEPEDLEAYLTLAGRGGLTGRVVGALWWDRTRGEEQVAELIERRDRSAVGRFRASAVKIMQDGVIEDFTAAVLEPYLDADGAPTSNRGISFVAPEALKQAVTRLDAEGFQVHVHAIGERAVREALDAFEAARASNGVRDSRHHIAHIQVVHPDDVPRFAALDVVANGQPYWACLEPQMIRLTIPFIGPERTGWQYPFGSLLRAGARLAFGSDWSVSTGNPLREVRVAVTRRPEPQDDPDQPAFLPEERLDLATAMTAFTAGSAFVNRLDDRTGTLEAGKLADLAVLDRDIFALDPMDIGTARVLMTLVEGEPVFAADGYEVVAVPAASP
jgi:predicted amidohydrolase YtcJ